MRRDLYYNNIPSKYGRLNYFDDFFKEFSSPELSFLEEIITPFFIITESGYVKELDSFEIDDEGIEILRKEGFSIFLDEPLTLYADDGLFNRGYYNEYLHDVDITTIKSLELDSIIKFARRWEIENVTVYAQDYGVEIYEQCYPGLTLKCLDIKIRWQISRGLEYPEISKNITKKFWCGNWRYTPTRHIIMSYINQYSGNFSWHLKAKSEFLNDINWFDICVDDSRIQQIKKGAIFLENNNFFIDQPKNLILEIVDRNVDTNTIPEYEAPNTMRPPFESYAECFCAIVNESTFAQPTGFLTEKTLCAIGNLRPIILVAGPRSLEYLKKLGFKTFDKWWDESYDLEPNHQKRLLKILDVIDYVNSLSITELNDIYKEMTEVLIYNKNKIKTLPFNKDALTIC